MDVVSLHAILDILKVQYFIIMIYLPKSCTAITILKIPSI